MAIRYRPSDFSKGVQGGCPACSGVQADVINGDVRIESAFSRLPGKAEWPLLGCLYRSTDGGSSPFGASRSGGGLLGMKVLTSNQFSPQVADETGELTYYTYSSGSYVNQSGGLNKLYHQPYGATWLLERSVGLYFQFDSAGKLTAGPSVRLRLAVRDYGGQASARQQTGFSWRRRGRRGRRGGGPGGWG